MALLKKFFNQTRKPEGFLGRLMLSGMNSGHAKLADWGFAHLPALTVSAAVVNLGCGLDDTFSRVDNGQCRGYNLDMPDVIAVRNELLPAAEREGRTCLPSN